MNKFVVLKLALLTAALVACVTINVYFPAAAAEKAADQIIGDVIGKAGDAPQPQRSSPVGSTAPDPGARGRTLGRAVLVAIAGAIDRTLAAGMESANAAGLDLDISTPTIRQITDAMKARHGQLAQFYDSGAIGYTSDGLVDIRDANLVSLAERNSVRKWVADENRDRAALYAEIARANGHPEWERDIHSTFAKRWIANAKAGWYYKDGGAWKRK
jgi:uncharacterized protein YdbL (DUF1318 family)